MKSLILPLAAAVALLAGCSTGRFAVSYALDPKPPRATFADLKPAASPQPVSLVFDMHRAEGPFPEGTHKFGPKLARIVEDSKLFTSVAKIGSENMARLQITLTEVAAVTGTEAKSLPAGLTSGLPGAEAAVLYMFTASYQPAGQAPVKKVYHHAIHVLNSKTGWREYSEPLTAGQATDAMLEQLTLNFLRDLQHDGKL
jgi:hypothetical protein